MKKLFNNTISENNLILDTDSYKYSHAEQYPENTETVFSYVEPRKSWNGYDSVLFFGLQIELAKLAGTVVTQEDIDEAKPFLDRHGLDLYIEGWQHIVDNYNGRLPVQIDALEEGTLAPVSIPKILVSKKEGSFLLF
jgi:nicotinamide phosphoribosyltransferase